MADHDEKRENHQQILWIKSCHIVTHNMMTFKSTELHKIYNAV